MGKDVMLYNEFAISSRQKNIIAGLFNIGIITIIIFNIGHYLRAQSIRMRYLHYLYTVVVCASGPSRLKATIKLFTAFTMANRFICYSFRNLSQAQCSPRFNRKRRCVRRVLDFILFPFFFFFFVCASFRHRLCIRGQGFQSAREEVLPIICPTKNKNPHSTLHGTLRFPSESPFIVRLILRDFV